jgi:hypothetical protein
MNLTLGQEQELQAVICAAFNESELEQLLRYHCDGDVLDHLVKSGPFQQVVFELIGVYRRSGVIDKLIEAIRIARPQNKRVQEFVGSLGGAIPAPLATSAGRFHAYLVDAIRWAHRYLKPQSLDLADSIAQAIRDSFPRSGVKPDRDNLLPLLRSLDPAERVVGYLAFQSQPIPGMGLDLIEALAMERSEAVKHKKTRPLWQLLVCFTILLSSKASSTTDRNLIRLNLRDFLQDPLSDPSIDPGGQCRRRINDLVSHRG